MRRRNVLRIPISVFVLLAIQLLAASLPSAAEDPAASDAALPSRRAVAQDPDYADHLVQEARRLRLYENPYWHTLLHYKRGITGLRSLVDDPKFFLSPHGKRDPKAEMEETIRAFFSPAVSGVAHPVCRFIARYYWLKQELGLDAAKLPVNECEDFTKLMQDLRPESTTLVFPTSLMNRPASMFGHTFLAYESESGNRLLARAVNYAAITQESSGPLFAVKGLFGFYKGYFSILPYYAKLQEYSDIDHRDMWEYRLNLSQEETLRSIRHVYEMTGIYSDYYFFDENCSYNLLFLLDAARPSLHLTDQLPPWVIPLDTIRAVKSAGLVSETIYVPSRTTRISHLAALVGSDSRRLALSVARGEAPSQTIVMAELSKEERIRTVDLTVEYLQYLYTRREIGRDDYTERYVRLLSARSSLGMSETGPDVVPSPAPPEEGHRSNRLQFGMGERNGRPFEELRYRFAYHTLTDYGRGYPEGSHIVFGDTAVRHYFLDDQVQLQRFDLVDIVSIVPRDDLFKPLSWKVTAGLAQHVMNDGRDHLVAQLSPGGGLAYRVPALGICYALVEGDLQAGDRLREDYAVGAGGSVGILRRLTDRWAAALQARGIYYAVGDRHGLLDVTLVQSYALAPNLALSMDLSRSRTREFYRTELKLGLNLFF